MKKRKMFIPSVQTPSFHTEHDSKHACFISNSPMIQCWSFDPRMSWLKSNKPWKNKNITVKKTRCFSPRIVFLKTFLPYFRFMANF